MSTVLDASAPAIDAASAPRIRWNPWTRIAFRFCFLYFGMYILGTQMLGGIIVIPGEWNLPELQTLPPFRTLISWTAAHVFGRTAPLVITGSGSGDKTFDWVAAFCLLVIASVGTVIWSLVDRRRHNYLTPHKWFRLFLRFATGSTMLSYGMIKAVPLQMPAPALTRLLEPFGNFSPMGVLWASIGASPGYERFAGIMELSAALLLFIPRTTTLGALVLLVDSVQIFALNMTYDVPVKLCSFHLILMAVVLLAPDARRLMNVLVLNRAAAAAVDPPLAGGARAQRALLAAQLVFAAYLIVVFVMSSRTSWTSYGGGAPKPALYGIWDVTTMSIDGVQRAPLVTDYDRWRRLVIQSSTSVAFQRMDQSFQFYPAATDMDRRTIVLTSPASAWSNGQLTFVRPDADHLEMDGTVGNKRVRMKLARVDRTKMLLLTRGFNWVQEYPFNR